VKLEKLIKRSKNMEDVLKKVQTFPRFYLVTDEHKKLNKATLEILYNKVKGVSNVYHTRLH
jgi:hypothetical protein